jgi:hypothetical protein
MKMRRLAIALSLLVFSACGEASTPTGIAADDVTVAQDGGLVVGSGNRSGQDSTATKQESSAAGGGGLVVGSGN